MPRRDPIRDAVLLIILALGPLGGCSTMASRSKEKAPSSILDTGPSAKVTHQQSADIQIALGRTMEEEGKPEEARPSYLAALKKDPSRADAELRLAVLDDRKGDQAGADKHFARALKLQPKNPEILCDRGYSLYLRRQWADAETSLKKALAIDPTHARSHMNLALVLARGGNSQDALKEFARAGCDPADARANLGLVLAMEGRLEEAKREYSAALAAKPSSTRAREGLRATSVAAREARRPRGRRERSAPPPQARSRLAADLDHIGPVVRQEASSARAADRVGHRSELAADRGAEGGHDRDQRGPDEGHHQGVFHHRRALFADCQPLEVSFHRCMFSSKGCGSIGSETPPSRVELDEMCPTQANVVRLRPGCQTRSPITRADVEKP